MEGFELVPDHLVSLTMGSVSVFYRGGGGFGGSSRASCSFPCFICVEVRVLCTLMRVIRALLRAPRCIAATIELLAAEFELAWRDGALQRATQPVGPVS